MVVKVRCLNEQLDVTKCFPAQFKLRGRENGSGFDVIDMFDLRTNPEEFEGFGDELNLASSTNADVVAVKNALKSRLSGWLTCINNHDPGNENADCEAQ